MRIELSPGPAVPSHWPGRWLSCGVRRTLVLLRLSHLELQTRGLRHVALYLYHRVHSS
jgi:hypothetical protein